MIEYLNGPMHLNFHSSFMEMFSLFNVTFLFLEFNPIILQDSGSPVPFAKFKFKGGSILYVYPFHKFKILEWEAVDRIWCLLLYRLFL